MTNLELWQGNGDEASPYLISSAEDLSKLAQQVGLYGDKHFRQTVNLNLSGLNWKPIGTGSNPFSGVYDGNFFLISHLTIQNDDFNDAGLFGFIDSHAKLQHICIESGKIENTQKYASIGSVAGRSNGLVEGCFSGAFITDAAKDGGGAERNIGGIVGKNYKGTIQQCVYAGSIFLKGPVTYVGGLAGVNQGNGQISYCVNNGSITGEDAVSCEGVGGVCGSSAGKQQISSCYHIAGISLPGAPDGQKGGILGIAGENAVTRCYYLDKSISGGNSIGKKVSLNKMCEAGFVKEIDNDSGLYGAEEQKAQCGCTSLVTPYLKAFYGKAELTGIFKRSVLFSEAGFAYGEGTESVPFEIHSYIDFLHMEKHKDKHFYYKLMLDVMIPVRAGEDHCFISGTFQGVLDGNNRTILLSNEAENAYLTQIPLKN